MKSITLTFIHALTVLATLAISLPLAAQDQLGHNKGHVRYTVINLGTLGGTSSMGVSISNNGWVAGVANLQGDQTHHAALWRRGQKIQDLGTLGGPDSNVDFPNKDDRGLIAGYSDTSNPDPWNEDFCYSGTGMICLGFLWQKGQMTPLATLGGNNAAALGANNRGQIAGFAENSTQDPDCIPPQVLDWEAVIWGPQPGEMHELYPLPGDAVGLATAINDEGQAVGTSGPCQSPNYIAHAVLWQKDGTPVDLGNFGGETGNAATAINSRGEIIGFSDLAGDLTGHAFLWTQDAGLQDLGTLSGDYSSTAWGLNNEGQVVGQSCDQSQNCRAFIWQNGVMTDLNTLISSNSSLYLTYGLDINDEGEITGQACVGVLSNGTCTGESPAFLAVPVVDGDKAD
jgi:probable HAF family extracellular repeat protein